jgi:cystathionine gamma-synthase
LNPPHPETLCVEAGHRGAAGEPVSPALYLSTTYHQGGEHEYIREGSPTIEAFERAVGSLEGGQSASTASSSASRSSHACLRP